MLNKGMLINNTLLVKKTNTELVRVEMRRSKTATRAEIAQLTGLSIATCGNILGEMLKSNEIFAGEMEESSGGRPAQRYRYNENFIQVACISVEYDNLTKTIRYFVANSFGDIIEEDKQVYDMVTYDTISKITQLILNKFPNIPSLTISIPGESYEGVIRFCDIEELKGVPMELDLAKEYNIKVHVEGSPHVTVYGYYKLNPELYGKTVAILIAPINVHLGSGIIVNGQLIKGDKHLAGEISFIASGNTREEALKIMATDKEFFMNSLVTAATAIISVVNPARLAITGGAVHENMRDILYQKCRDIVPEVFMPQLEIIPNVQEFLENGLIQMAINHTSSSLKLITDNLS